MNLPHPRLWLSALSSAVRRRWSWLRSRSDAAQIEAAIAVCQRAAAGDLEARVLVLAPRTRGGRLGLALNAVLDVSDAFTREAAAAMEACSRDRYHRPIVQRGLRGAYQTSADTINRAASRMKSHRENLDYVDRRAAETHEAVHAVAVACEELNATTSGIAGQSADVAARARRIASRLDATRRTLEQLEAAVQKVDKVVSLLNDVALQTQRLGLNATIEAAHAGAHGNAFGVVANEVKLLSDQTRSAAAEIHLELVDIQERTEAAGGEVRGIADDIDTFETATHGIDQSIREQLDASRAIREHMTSVARMSEDVAERIRGHSRSAAVAV